MGMEPQGRIGRNTVAFGKVSCLETLHDHPKMMLNETDMNSIGFMFIENSQLNGESTSLLCSLMTRAEFRR